MAWNLFFHIVLSLLITAAFANKCSLDITGQWKANETLTVEEGTILNLTFQVISPECEISDWTICIAAERFGDCLISYRRRYGYSLRPHATCLGECNVVCEDTRPTCVFTTIVSRFRTQWTRKARGAVRSLPDPSPSYHWLLLNVTYPPRLTSFTSRVYNQSHPISTISFVELVCLWEEGFPQRSVIIRDIRTGRILSESSPAQKRTRQLNYSIDAAEICGQSHWYTCESQGVHDIRVAELNVGCHRFSTAAANISDNYHSVWLLLKDSTVQLIAVAVSLIAFAIGCIAGLLTGIFGKKSACCKYKRRKTKLSCRKVSRVSSGKSPEAENVTGAPVEDLSDDYEYPDLAVITPTAKPNNYIDGFVHFRRGGDAEEEDVDYENTLNLNRH